MAEEVSLESKIYVKEEIEKMRKEFKEDLEKANSKATKTFATVALIVGLLGSFGIYGLLKGSINDATLAEIKEKANANANLIQEYKEEIFKPLKGDYKLVPIYRYKKDGDWNYYCSTDPINHGSGWALNPKDPIFYAFFEKTDVEKTE